MAKLIDTLSSSSIDNSIEMFEELRRQWTPLRSKAIQIYSGSSVIYTWPLSYDTYATFNALSFISISMLCEKLAALPLRPAIILK